jgi:hypothetical protein
MGPRANVDAMKKNKNLALAGNQSPAVQPVAIPTLVHRVRTFTTLLFMPGHVQLQYTNGNSTSRQKIMTVFLVRIVHAGGLRNCLAVSSIEDGTSSSCFCSLIRGLDSSTNRGFLNPITTYNANSLNVWASCQY